MQTLNALHTLHFTNFIQEIGFIYLFRKLDQWL